MWVFVSAPVEADDFLACVRAYFVTQSFEREEVEVEEVGEERNFFLHFIIRQQEERLKRNNVRIK